MYKLYGFIVRSSVILLLPLFNSQISDFIILLLNYPQSTCLIHVGVMGNFDTFTCI